MTISTQVPGNLPSATEIRPAALSVTVLYFVVALLLSLYWGGWIRTSDLLINRKVLPPKKNRTTGAVAARPPPQNRPPSPSVPGIVPV